MRFTYNANVLVFCLVSAAIPVFSMDGEIRENRIPGEVRAASGVTTHKLGVKQPPSRRARPLDQRLFKAEYKPENDPERVKLVIRKRKPPQGTPINGDVEKEESDAKECECEDDNDAKLDNTTLQQYLDNDMDPVEGSSEPWGDAITGLRTWITKKEMLSLKDTALTILVLENGTITPQEVYRGRAITTTITTNGKTSDTAWWWQVDSQTHSMLYSVLISSIKPAYHIRDSTKWGYETDKHRVEISSCPKADEFKQPITTYQKKEFPLIMLETGFKDHDTLYAKLKKLKRYAWEAYYYNHSMRTEMTEGASCTFKDNLRGSIVVPTAVWEDMQNDDLRKVLTNIHFRRPPRKGKLATLAPAKGKLITPASAKVRKPLREKITEAEVVHLSNKLVVLNLKDGNIRVRPVLHTTPRMIAFNSNVMVKGTHKNCNITFYEGTERNCSGKHGLQRFHDHGGATKRWHCSDCKHIIPEQGFQMMGCRKCDYDLCIPCWLNTDSFRAEIQSAISDAHGRFCGYKVEYPLIQTTLENMPTDPKLFSQALNKDFEEAANYCRAKLSKRFRISADDDFPFSGAIVVPEDEWEAHKSKYIHDIVYKES